MHSDDPWEKPNYVSPSLGEGWERPPLASIDFSKIDAAMKAAAEFAQRESARLFAEAKAKDQEST